MKLVVVTCCCCEPVTVYIPIGFTVDVTVVVTVDFTVDVTVVDTVAILSLLLLLFLLSLFFSSIFIVTFVVVEAKAVFLPALFHIEGNGICRDGVSFCDVNLNVTQPEAKKREGISEPNQGKQVRSDNEASQLDFLKIWRVGFE